jgi:tRNA1(Val) A37 N6-methylase TrmN6
MDWANDKSVKARFEDTFEYESISILQELEIEPPQCVYDAVRLSSNYKSVVLSKEVIQTLPEFKGRILELGAGCGFASIDIA